MISLKEKIQGKYRITIPKEMRKRLNLIEGDTVQLSLEKDKIIISPEWHIDNPTERMSGLVKAERISPSDLERAISRHRAKKAGGK